MHAHITYMQTCWLSKRNRYSHSVQLQCSTGLRRVKNRGDCGGPETVLEICQEGKFCHRYTQDSGLLNRDVICSHSVWQKQLKFMFSLHFNFPLWEKFVCTEDFCPSASPSMHICVQGYFNHKHSLTLPVLQWQPSHHMPGTVRKETGVLGSRSVLLSHEFAAPHGACTVVQEKRSLKQHN